MQSGREAWLNLKTRTEVLPEAGCELRPSIRYDRLWQSMVAENPIAKEVHQSFRGNRSRTGDKMPLFGQAIDHYAN